MKQYGRVYNFGYGSLFNQASVQATKLQQASCVDVEEAKKKHESKDQTMKENFTFASIKRGFVRKMTYPSGPPNKFWAFGLHEKIEHDGEVLGGLTLVANRHEFLGLVERETNYHLVQLDSRDVLLEPYDASQRQSHRTSNDDRKTLASTGNCFVFAWAFPKDFDIEDVPVDGEHDLVQSYLDVTLSGIFGWSGCAEIAEEEAERADYDDADFAPHLPESVAKVRALDADMVADGSAATSAPQPPHMRKLPCDLAKEKAALVYNVAVRPDNVSCPGSVDDSMARRFVETTEWPIKELMSGIVKYVDDRRCPRNGNPMVTPPHALEGVHEGGLATVGVKGDYDLTTRQIDDVLRNVKVDNSTSLLDWRKPTDCGFAKIKRWTDGSSHWRNQ